MSSRAAARWWSTLTRRVRPDSGAISERLTSRSWSRLTHRAVARVLEAARNGGAELAIIDTAPHSSDAALAAARGSDLTLVPCRASVADLHAIKASLDICRVAGVPARVVLNAIPVQGPLAGQAREAMAECRAEVAPTMLCQRVAHVHSFTKGMSAMEFSPQSKAAAELQALYRWVMTEGGNLEDR